MESNFASPEREEQEKIFEHFDIIKRVSIITEILNTFSDMVVILNNHRQIVYANNAFLENLHISDFKDALGQRPGELVNCVYAHETSSGCGTAHNCRYCGAVLTVLESQNSGKKVANEARITTQINDRIIQLDLLVTASPLEISGEYYTLAILKDISNVKRREYLEQSFLHDIINSTWALANRIELFPIEKMDDEQIRRCYKIKEEIKKIMFEIESQRDLIRIENNELVTIFSHTNTRDVIISAVNTISTHKVANEKTITIDQDTINKNIETDSRLLQRILVNLLKNALEASETKETVTIGCKAEEEEKVIFWVKSNTIISDEIKSQIFQKSFSTKGRGRGMGTFGVKILTENFLKGKASLVSSLETKTIFNVELPISQVNKG